MYDWYYEIKPLNCAISYYRLSLSVDDDRSTFSNHLYKIYLNNDIEYINKHITQHKFFE